MEKRSVGCTQLNEQSSRSHAVFTLRIEGHNDSSKLKVCESGLVEFVRPDALVRGLQGLCRATHTLAHTHRCLACST
jgi:hypothetical protein